MTITRRAFPSTVVSNTGSVVDPWEDTNLVLGYSPGSGQRALLISRSSGFLGGTSNTKSGTLVLGFDLPPLVDPTGIRATFNLTVGRVGSNGTMAYTLQLSVDGGATWQTVFDRPAGAGHGFRTYSADLSEHIPAGMTAADVLVRISGTVVSGTGDGSLASINWYWSWVQVADSGANHVYPVPADYPLGREASPSDVIGYGHSWMNPGGYETAGNHFLEQFATHFGGAHVNRATSGITSVETSGDVKGNNKHWDVHHDSGAEPISTDEGIAIVSSALNDNNYTADSRLDVVKDQLKTDLAAFKASARITHDQTATPPDLVGITAYWTYTGTWNNDTGSAPGGMNGYHLSGDANATATFTFDSSEEVCVVVTGWAIGIAGIAPIDVYFDNVFQYTINTEDYFVAATEQTGNAIAAAIPLSFRGLDPTVQHTVRIEHAGVGGDQISIEGAYVTTPADVAKQPVIVLFEGYPSEVAIAAYNNADVDATRATFANYFSYVQAAVDEMGGEEANIWLLDIRPTIDFQINPAYFGSDELHLTDAGMNEIYTSYLLTGPSVPTSTGDIQSTLPSFTQSSLGSSTPPVDTGTIQSTLPSFSQSANASYTKPVDVGQINSVLPSIVQSAIGQHTEPDDPVSLAVAQQGADVVLQWPAPSMAGATHVAIFRRTGTSDTPFDPEVDVEIGRVPIGTLEYIDNNVPVGDYAYQVFPVDA